MFSQMNKLSSPATLAIAASFSLVLSGCFGGSGSARGPIVDAITDLLPDLPLSDVQTAKPAEALDAAAQAATALPRFGSVTQSTNRNNGVSSDTATTTFDGRNLTVNIMREDGSSIRLDTAGNAVTTALGTPLIAGYSTRDWGLLSVTRDAAAVAYTVVSWVNDDPSDYLAGGYWLYLPRGDDLSFTGDIEAGAFVHGPEFSLSNPPTLPIQGRAIYNGPAQGFYAYQYGYNWADVAQGSAEVGEYFGTASLTADFGDGTIDGCVGCVGAVTLSGYRVDGSSGRTIGITDSTNVQIHLGETPFASDGTFRSNEVRVVSPGRTVTRSSGAWGGKFSNVPDSVGDPRLVVGTTGGEFLEDDGSRGVFLGAFLGRKNP